jgi:hypothetical protein
MMPLRCRNLTTMASPQWDMMRFPTMLILALPLLGAADAAEPAPERGRFGDFTYDASTYVVTELSGRYIVRGRDGDADEQWMVASFQEGPASDCSAAKLAAEVPDVRGERYDWQLRTISRDGFKIHMVRWYLGCRNARPPSIAACTAYRGRVYTFRASSIGCKGGPGFSAAPEGFLGSLAAVP